MPTPAPARGVKGRASSKRGRDENSGNEAGLARRRDHVIATGAGVGDNHRSRLGLVHRHDGPAAEIR
jgi:hypothetical protein